MKFSYENNLLSIDNYKQIMEIKHDLIQVQELIIIGNDFKILYLDAYKIVVKGKINRIELGDNKYDLQNNNEKK